MLESVQTILSALGANVPSLQFATSMMMSWPSMAWEMSWVEWF